ncbi:MAG TPA: 2-hydroxyacid dehydrogenase [Tissierellaceae bacterium]|nr:2-hydroxyacid dehydrogenase [Tissierellaceae bacterium]
MKITILEPLGVSEEELREIAKPLTAEGHELVIYNEKSSDNEVLKERVKDTDVLIIANSPLEGEVIRAAKNLKMLSVAFTGVDHVDLEACKEKGVLVSNAAGYSTPAVVELAFGLMISLFRNIVPLDKVTREGGTKDGYGQREIYGKTLGVVGTGDIGSDVAEVGLAFGCDVIAYNRSENKDLKSKGVKYVDIKDLLKESDIVTIHLPLTDETKEFIDKEKLELMKEDAILVNAARGPIIDNKALAETLNEGKIAGAGIDVFDIEPPLDTDNPLLSAKNTVVAPHIGFASEEAMVRRAKIVFENISSWEKDKPQNVIQE